MPLTMNDDEIKSIDSKIEPMIAWATSRTYEAEQLAFDATRLLSCTGERMDKLAKQGFAKRIWSRVTGEASAIERANTNDLIHMQKISLRYINMLEEQELLLAHSMLSLKNNLFSLAVKEKETRDLIDKLAKRTLARFEKLENRVEQLEISTNLNSWITTLKARKYKERIPTEHMRLFQLINDFYFYKNDSWNYQDYLFMVTAIDTVGLNPETTISLNSFIDSLIDEIQQDSVGFDKYQEAITKFKPEVLDDYSEFVIEQISSPVFVSMHGLKMQYLDRQDMIEELKDEFKISTEEALKRLLRRSIKNMNVNLDCKLPLAHTAMEILGCMRLANFLSSQQSEVPLTESEPIDAIAANEAEGAKQREQIGDDSVKGNICVICGTVLYNNDHLSVKDGDKIYNFCSYDCRDNYLQNLGKPETDIKKTDKTTNDFENFIESECMGLLDSDSSGLDKSLYIKNCYLTDVPKKKIMSGINSFAQNITVNDVIAYFDSTLFGGGDEGFIITKDKFYFKESFKEPQFFIFNDILRVKFIKNVLDNDIFVYCNHNNYKLSYTNVEFTKNLYNIFTNIINYK